MSEAAAAGLLARLLPQIEATIARLLEFDPETHAALLSMEGRVVSIEVAGLPSRLFLFPGAHGLAIRLDHDGETHVRIRGTPAGFATLARSRLRGEPIPAGTISIEGDLSTAQRVQRIIDRLDIDWEEMLSRVLGDTAARKLGNLARDLRHWLRGSGQSLALNFSEYVRYETEVVPEREAVDGFMHGVDMLRADSDRLSERVRRLQRLLSQRAGR